ncbi:MAG: TraR/DksA C4-type zinc finger protein [Acidimicrobiia bacterium]|nr:TraR/DksA C4-type zinc finger protein [Acidimicrobiia bacterium]
MPGATGKQSGARRVGTKKTMTKAAGRTAATRVKPASTRTKPVAKKVAKAPAKKSTKPVAKKIPKKVTKKSTKPVAKKIPKKVTKAVAPAKAAGARKKTVICELSGFEVTPGKPKLSPKTLDRLRHKLLEEQKRLQGQADELAAEAEQLARDREGGDTQFDEESGDGDIVNIERERDLLLSASARQVVDEIGDALARMKKGTYGVCTPAGRRLPLERLEAIPWANVCVDCKARAERRR